MKNKLSAFIGLVICFLLTTIVIRITDCLWTISRGIECEQYCSLLVEDLSSIGIQVLVTFILFIVIASFSKKAAIITCSTLFCILSFLEICLSIYTGKTGIVMGRELFLRPIWEIVSTTHSAIHFINYLECILFIGLYIYASLQLAKKKITKSNILLAVITAFSLISAPLFFTITPNSCQQFGNKIGRCIHASLDTSTLTKDEQRLKSPKIDSLYLQSYSDIYSDRGLLDSTFVLERKNTIPNVLKPYFKTDSTQPNVVIIIVESLGADLMGENPDKVCFMPFLKSLTKKSLYWKNCLSTTPRSFGAVPAVTGSVPHGLKGFQFGDIPKHNSLLSLLKSNGYNTNAFYAGNFSFDRIYDYLIAQDIDYMSPYYDEFCKDNDSEKDGTYWGYNDDVLFQKSLEQVCQRDSTKPYCDLYVTISQHENLNLKDKKLQESYYTKAQKLYKSLSKKSQNILQDNIGVLASTLYADDAIQHFLTAYSKSGLDKNTIFVITGDHSMNLDKTNPLDPYHVPLIIWSPLLKQAKTYNSVVSHNDIAPSLSALLSGNFSLPKTETVQWVGEGLDTAVHFRSNINQYFLRYSREIVDGIIGDYYFSAEDGQNTIYKIQENLRIGKQEKKNSKLQQSIVKKLQSLVYIDNYVYTNNSITFSPLLQEKQYKLIKTIQIDSITCNSPQEKPSISGRIYADLLKDNIPGQFSELKVTITGEISYTGNVYQDQFISIVFNCEGDSISKIYNEDYISKYIQSSSYQANKKYPIQITKTLALNNSSNPMLSIYMMTTHKDDVWNPKHSVSLYNVKLSIFANENE